MCGSVNVPTGQDRIRSPNLDSRAGVTSEVSCYERMAAAGRTSLRPVAISRHDLRDSDCFLRRGSRRRGQNKARFDNFRIEQWHTIMELRARLSASLHASTASDRDLDEDPMMIWQTCCTAPEQIAVGKEASYEAEWHRSAYPSASDRMARRPWQSDAIGRPCARITMKPRLSCLEMELCALLPSLSKFCPSLTRRSANSMHVTANAISWKMRSATRRHRNHPPHGMRPVPG